MKLRFKPRQSGSTSQVPNHSVHCYPPKRMKVVFKAMGNGTIMTRTQFLSSNYMIQSLVHRQPLL